MDFCLKWRITEILRGHKIYDTGFTLKNDLRFSAKFVMNSQLAVLAQMVACLPLVQQVRGSIPDGVVNFHLKIFNLGARRDGDVHFLITRWYITVLD